MKMDSHRERISHRYNFTEEEKKEMAFRVTSEYEKLGQAEEAKKDAMKGFAEEISKIELGIADLSRKVNSGWEFREYLVDVEIDYNTKMKVFRDAVTGAILKSQELTREDLQRKLEFQS